MTTISSGGPSPLIRSQSAPALKQAAPAQQAHTPTPTQAPPKTPTLKKMATSVRVQTQQKMVSPQQQASIHHKIEHTNLSQAKLANVVKVASTIKLISNRTSVAPTRSASSSRETTRSTRNEKSESSKKSADSEDDDDSSSISDRIEAPRGQDQGGGETDLGGGGGGSDSQQDQQQGQQDSQQGQPDSQGQQQGQQQNQQPSSPSEQIQAVNDQIEALGETRADGQLSVRQEASNVKKHMDDPLMELSAFEFTGPTDPSEPFQQAELGESMQTFVSQGVKLVTSVMEGAEGINSLREASSLKQQAKASLESALNAPDTVQADQLFQQSQAQQTLASSKTRQGLSSVASAMLGIGESSSAISSSAAAMVGSEVAKNALGVVGSTFTLVSETATLAKSINGAVKSSKTLERVRSFMANPNEAKVKGLKKEALQFTKQATALKKQAEAIRAKDPAKADKMLAMAGRLETQAAARIEAANKIDKTAKVELNRKVAASAKLVEKSQTFKKYFNIFKAIKAVLAVAAATLALAGAIAAVVMTGGAALPVIAIVGYSLGGAALAGGITLGAVKCGKARQHKQEIKTMEAQLQKAKTQIESLTQQKSGLEDELKAIHAKLAAATDPDEIKTLKTQETMTKQAITGTEGRLAEWNAIRSETKDNLRSTSPAHSAKSLINRLNDPDPETASQARAILVTTFHINAEALRGAEVKLNGKKIVLMPGTAALGDEVGHAMIHKLQNKLSMFY